MPDLGWSLLLLSGSRNTEKELEKQPQQIKLSKIFEITLIMYYSKIRFYICIASLNLYLFVPESSAQALQTDIQTKKKGQHLIQSRKKI